MIDIIGVIAVVAIYALLVGVLFGFSGMDRRVKFVSIAAAVVWAAGIIALAAAGGFAPRAAGPIPAPILTFAGLLLLLLGAWLFLPGFRAGLLIVPLPALVGVNIARLGGVMFLILEAKGRLSAPFAPVAGWGDITVAALAIPLALMARESSRNAIWLSIWNALGALDLFVAITLGLLSAPGTPLRVFTEGPGTLSLTTLPLLVVPTMLVPLYVMIHLVIAVKLRSLKQNQSELRTNSVVSVHSFGSR